ncbi:hypothetical protein [Hoeflea sp.]|uniref:hypothetical protein n=1 Tax=Hoeflea sp. TaxID=1940281 RepID=UPI003A937DFA
MTCNHFPKALAPLLAGALAACILMVTPHVSLAEAAKVGTPDTVGPSAGVLETSATTYAFTPVTCIIHMEDGVPDIEVQGPGLTPDGESFYFDFSSTANEMTIELGVDEPYQSAGRKLQAGQYVSAAFEVDVADGIVSVTGLNLVDGQSEPMDASASLRIDCNT